MKQVVITSAVRTPLGRFNGTLRTIPATDLGAVVIREAIHRAGISAEHVDECIMGMVLPCGCGQNPAKQAAIKAGLSWNVGAFTVNKVCGSGLKAVMLAIQAIRSGEADVIVAGGMENMTLAPYFLKKARAGFRMGPGTIDDHMVHDGLWDHINGFHMGESNELCCERWGVDRESQDRYAEESYRRAMAAIRSGRFEAEIVPVSVTTHTGTQEFKVDECPGETDYKTLASMPPVFRPDGMGTAGNASSISDGAAAVVVMSEQKARELDCRVMAVTGAQATSGIDMKYVLMAPVHAIPKCIDKDGGGIHQIGCFEINEAFSGSSVAINRALGLDPERVNPNGGGVALGHPIGASGCRVLVTLIHEMIRENHRNGLASLCLGGGEAVALMLHR